MKRAHTMEEASFNPYYPYEKKPQQSGVPRRPPLPFPENSKAGCLVSAAFPLNIQFIIT